MLLTRLFLPIESKARPRIVTGNEQTSLAVPGRPPHPPQQLLSDTQTERISRHANTATGRPGLIVQTLRKWSPGWYVFYRRPLNWIAIFIMETEREERTLSLSLSPGDGWVAFHEKVQVRISVCTTKHPVFPALHQLRCNENTLLKVKTLSIKAPFLRFPLKCLVYVLNTILHQEYCDTSSVFTHSQFKLHNF